MSKFFLWIFISYILGNPFLALILLVIIFYFLDRRFLGFFPNIFAPIKRRLRIKELRRELAINPHHQTNKLQLAKEYIEQKNYREAVPLLQDLMEPMEERADVLYLLGLSLLKTGKPAEGIPLITKCLEEDQRLFYGEPYIVLAEHFIGVGETEKAIQHLHKASDVNSSSVRVFYRLGELYLLTKNKTEAKESFRQALDIYRSSPRFIRKRERRWANRSRIRLLLA